MGVAVDNYRESAQEVAKLITDPTFWKNYVDADNNFWRIANAFTTLIDYFAITGQADLFIGESTYEAFRSRNRPGWWYDDYSWWIVAHMQAARHSALVGYDEATWRGLAQVCWGEIEPASQVWANADQKYFAEAKPRFEGGCWNHDFVSNSQPNRCDPIYSTDPWPVCGIQNTVTNTQYVVSAARLSQAADAKRQYGWLRRWFSDPSLSPDQKLLVGYGQTSALVRERVSTFAQQSGVYPPTLNYDKDRHWTGDQGIILGALLEMIPLDPPGRDGYINLARIILDGVRTKLVNDSQILQPWMPADSIDSSYYIDYVTGVGVFMRYLLYLYNSGNPAFVQHISSPVYKSFIQANADAACNGIGQCPSFPDGSPADKMECLLNQLATLNAAMTILT